ncbi:MAG: thioredoxin [Oscillospiraceae bacterium]|nr:thioredoxin [Oscillospiraceae bacterium]
MSVIHLNHKEQFESEVIHSEQPVLLDFWAPWCGPCRALSPVLDEVAAERPDVKVVKVSVDEAPELARQFRVMSVPSLFVMKDGKVETRAVGGRSKDEILNML